MLKKWWRLCVCVVSTDWHTSHPHVPTNAAICAAVLPTELTTSVSAPASNIIHVISVFPAGTQAEESQTCGRISQEILSRAAVMINTKHTFTPTAYLIVLQTSALCIHVHVHCNSHPLRVAAAVCTCLLFLYKQHA